MRLDGLHASEVLKASVRQKMQELKDILDPHERVLNALNRIRQQQEYIQSLIETWEKGCQEREDAVGVIPGVGLDLQVTPPSDFLGGVPLSFVLGFALPCDIDKPGVGADYHPLSGVADSFLDIEENWILRLLLAYRLMSIGQTQVWLLGGVQFTDLDVQFVADETGSMGIVNRFTEPETMVIPVLGLGFLHPLCDMAAQLVGSWYITWLDDIRGGGQSTLGLNYRYEADGGVQTEFHLGVRIPIR